MVYVLYVTYALRQRPRQHLWGRGISLSLSLSLSMSLSLSNPFPPSLRPLVFGTTHAGLHIVQSLTCLFQSHSTSAPALCTRGCRHQALTPHAPPSSSPAADGAAILLPSGSADTAALRYSTIASRSPADSTVAFPLATCRHCFSSGQMPWCEMP